VALATLGDPKYISIRSYRKSGASVDTPVWAVASAGRLYVTTPPESGKGKRIRNNPLVDVCPSDMRGRPTGEWMPAEAHFTDDAATCTTVLGLLKRKYGIQFRIAMWRSRNAERLVLEIRDRA
jgi:PPOX class probable F420-dependent enzyme